MPQVFQINSGIVAVLGASTDRVAAVVPEPHVEARKAPGEWYYPNLNPSRVCPWKLFVLSSRTYHRDCPGRTDRHKRNECVILDPALTAVLRYDVLARKRKSGLPRGPKDRLTQPSRIPSVA